MNVLLSDTSTISYVSNLNNQVLTNGEQNSEKESKKAINKLNQTLKTISSIEFEGRLPGSLGWEKFLEYILNRLNKPNVEGISKNEHVKKVSEPSDSKFILPFLNFVDSFRIRFKNIVAKITGTTYPDKIIIFTAHYDHLGPRAGKYFLGADDNASGTTCLIELIDYFSVNKPKHTLVFFFTDGEEIDLYGSDEFVKFQIKDVIDINNILVNINIDMIARLNKNLTWIGKILCPKIYPYYENFLKTQDISFVFKGDDPDPQKQTEFFVNRSDQWHFYRKNVPFVFFTTDDNNFYHTTDDVFENVNQDDFTKVYNFIQNFTIYTDNLLQGNDLFRPVVPLSQKTLLVLENQPFKHCFTK